MKLFFKMHRATLITAPAFILYIMYLPGQKDKNTIVPGIPASVETPMLPAKTGSSVPGFDKTYTLSWVFRMNNNQ